MLEPLADYAKHILISNCYKRCFMYFKHIFKTLFSHLFTGGSVTKVIFWKHVLVSTSTKVTTSIYACETVEQV